MAKQVLKRKVLVEIDFFLGAGISPAGNSLSYYENEENCMLRMVPGTPQVTSRKPLFGKSDSCTPGSLFKSA